MLLAIRHRPSTAFSLLAIVAFLVTAIVAGLAGQLPTVSVRTQHGMSGSVLVDGKSAGLREQLATLSSANNAFAVDLPLRELVGELEARGTPSENVALFARRDQISSQLAEGPLTLRLPDGRTLAVVADRTHGFHLSIDAWVALGVGFISLIVGLWVLVLRPREIAAQLFAASGASLWVASLTIALIAQSNVATPGWAMNWLLQINHVSALFFGWALISTFGVYPQRIVPSFAITSLAILCLGLGIAGILDISQDVFGAQLIALCLVVAMSFVLVLVQAWKSRNDPVHRASIAWVGTALVLSAGIFTAVNFIPILLGSPPLVGDAFAMTAFLLFYFALAVAITRYRMFDLGNWTVDIIRAVAVLLLVLVADMALVYWAGEQWTLSFAVLLIGLAWMPVRGRLMRLAERRRDRDHMRLIRGANQVAFAIHPTEQAASWQSVLSGQYDPLEMHATTAAAVEIRDDGRVLAIPSPLGEGAMALSYAGKGSRLFDTNDLEMAKALHHLVEEMIAARRAYDQGVREERTRIARDLHDDVGARLLTGLHMADPDLRPTLQAAMSDIRAIVSGMTGEQEPLGGLLAQIRHETARRLEAAAIQLDWPIPDAEPAEYLLDYRQHKAITSAIREVVSNSIRHARASAISVRIDVSEDQFRATIRDDGQGMPEQGSAGAAPGYGLRSLLRRMSDVGGRMEVRSGSDGTEVSLSMPLTHSGRVAPPEQGVTGLSSDLRWQS